MRRERRGEGRREGEEGRGRERERRRWEGGDSHEVDGGVAGGVDGDGGVVEVAVVV